MECEICLNQSEVSIMTLTEYTNNVKNAMDIVRLFSHQFSWLEQLNLIYNTILLENKDVQKLIIEQLVFKFCGFQPRFMRNGLRQAAIDLGIYTTLEKNPVYLVPAKVNIVYVSLSSSDRTKLIKDIDSTDWSYNEAYADRLSKADYQNIAQRDNCVATLHRLNVAELRLIWSGIANENAKEIIQNVASKFA